MLLESQKVRCKCCKWRNHTVLVRMSKNYDTHLRPNYRNFDRYGRRKKISKPHILGYFSVDQHRQFFPNHSNCKYLKLPPSDQPIHFDLNEGYELVHHKPDSAKEENLDHILKFILLNLKKLASRKCAEKLLDVDVICFRGKLRMLMCTPYEFREAWSLLATKWKGNVYLCGFETDRDKAKRLTQTDESKKICSYGFKFEQFLMSDSPTMDADTSAPVHEAEEFCCMFTTRLESTSILFGAEMDGIESSTVLDLSKTNFNDLKFTELKVRLKASNQRQIDNYHRFKTRNWWCQSYLTNVQKIVVGLRTEDGIVDELESIDVESLPRMYEQFWSDTVCMEFLNSFLCMVKHQLKTVDCPHTVYRFDYDPKTSSSIRCTVLNKPNRCSFLPDWYINEVTKQHSSK